MNGHRHLDRLLLWTVLVGALALRLFFVGRMSPNAVFASVDARGYHLLATNLVEYGAFSPPDSSPSVLAAIRMPLYPAMLALILTASGDASYAVPVFQAVLDVLIVALVYSLASRLTHRRCGLLAAFLYAINPISFLFIGQALTEILLAFLMTCTFLVFTIALAADQRRLLLLGATGLVSALCILCKPNVAWLPLVLAFALICQHRRLSRQAFKEASILLAAALVAVLPWLVRNRLTYGEWFLSLAFDDNLAHVSAVATLFEAQNEEVAPWTPRWEEAYASQIVAPTSDAYGWAERDSLPARHEALRKQREMATTARELIRQYPEAFFVSHLKGVMRSFVPSVHRYWYAYVAREPWPEKEALRTTLEEAWSKIGNGQWHSGLDIASAWWSRHPPLAQGLWLASAIVQILGYLLVTVGLWRLRNRPGVLVGAALILLCLALLPGPIAYIRFWVPGVPLAATLIGVALCRSEGTNRSSADSDENRSQA